MPMEIYCSQPPDLCFHREDDSAIITERLKQILELDEDRLIAGFQQQVQKARKSVARQAHQDENIFNRVILCSFMTADS